MQRLVLVVIALIAATPQASWAVRVLEIVERSYELSLGDVNLPASSSGAVVVKECATCKLESLAVTGSTRYYFNKQLMTITELQQQVAAIGQAARADGSTIVAVHYKVDTKVVTRIRVNTSNVH
jgi:hypothetical protein